MTDIPKDPAEPASDASKKTPEKKPETQKPPEEIGGRGGLEPTRYGDWESGGRCVDF